MSQLDELKKHTTVVADTGDFESESLNLPRTFIRQSTSPLLRLLYSNCLGSLLSLVLSKKKKDLVCFIAMAKITAHLAYVVSCPASTQRCPFLPL